MSKLEVDAAAKVSRDFEQIESRHEHMTLGALRFSIPVAVAMSPLLLESRTLSIANGLRPDMVYCIPCSIYFQTMGRTLAGPYRLMLFENLGWCFFQKMVQPLKLRLNSVMSQSIHYGCSSIELFKHYLLIQIMRC